ncbi:DUF2511 domain-containing protein [Mycobacteroides salmoniphilum]|uniref:Uncharacterized protein n=1 Tax=Mycobacteroides salmoniphilum TaxID=404941 RepID=A0A4R8SGK9_9MYCO|nr:hypothetical protein CCUG60885_02196 [Mycobacteroides salmoniphilum]TEA05155.1 hypothetical protein CCUG60883_02455 [Mycobacteroides salmoniphilum]
MAGRILPFILLTLSVAACSTTQGEPNRSSTPATTSPGWVTEASWKAGPWPLTASEGVLACKPPGLVTFTSDGTTYAVNGTAKSLKRYPEIDQIWKDDRAGGG